MAQRSWIRTIAFRRVRQTIWLVAVQVTLATTLITGTAAQEVHSSTVEYTQVDGKPVLGYLAAPADTARARRFC